jgi:Fe-S cluster assembly protein SufD
VNDLTPLNIFDPSSYPTRRDEEWHYSDLARALRKAPKPDKTNYGAYEGDEAPQGFHSIRIHYADYSTLALAHKLANGHLYISHYSIGDDEAVGHQGRGQLALTSGESLVVFERYQGDSSYADSTGLDFKLAEGASLTRIVILDEPTTATSIRRSTVETAPNSTFKQYVFSTGAAFQRFETHVDHVGQGAVVEVHGAYLLKDKTHFDYTTRITHSGPDGITAQTIKGLVKDQATAVFQGRILVERGADGTDARMQHQALMLNDGAHVRAKPELEIYADDVQCAHGNTIGALDEAALFFCQSRGMPEAVARSLLTQAFVLPVAEMIEDEAIRAKALEFLNEKAEAFHGL